MSEQRRRPRGALVSLFCGAGIAVGSVVVGGSPYEASTTVAVTATPQVESGLCGRDADFVVDGTTYTASSPSKVAAYCDDVGEQVTVQFNPDNPQVSQVKDGWPMAALDYLGPAVGSLLFGFGGLRLVLGQLAAGAARSTARAATQDPTQNS